MISLAGLAADWNWFAFSNHNITESQSQNAKEELRIMCLVMTQETFPKVCFVVTEDSLQDKLETICMTANTVVNQSVFHFFKEKFCFSK